MAAANNAAKGTVLHFTIVAKVLSLLLLVTTNLSELFGDDDDDNDDDDEHEGHVMPEQDGIVFYSRTQTPSHMCEYITLPDHFGSYDIL